MSEIRTQYDEEIKKNAVKLSRKIFGGKRKRSIPMDEKVYIRVDKTCLVMMEEDNKALRP